MAYSVQYGHVLESLTMKKTCLSTTYSNISCVIFQDTKLALLNFWSNSGLLEKTIQLYHIIRWPLLSKWHTWKCHRPSITFQNLALPAPWQYLTRLPLTRTLTVCVQKTLTDFVHAVSQLIHCNIYSGHIRRPAVYVDVSRYHLYFVCELSVMANKSLIYIYILKFQWENRSFDNLNSISITLTEKQLYIYIYIMSILLLNFGLLDENICYVNTLTYIVYTPVWCYYYYYNWCSSNWHVFYYGLYHKHFSYQ